MAFVTLAALFDRRATGTSPAAELARFTLQHQHVVAAAALPPHRTTTTLLRGKLAARTAAAVMMEAHQVEASKSVDPSETPRPSRRPPPRTHQQQLRIPRAQTASTRRRKRRPAIRKTLGSIDPNADGWRCPACGARLHRQQTDCSICQTPKPAPGGSINKDAEQPRRKRHVRADVRSRVFTTKIRSMPVGDWRGVLRELEEEERLEAADGRRSRPWEEGEVDEAAVSLGAPSVHCYHAVMHHLEQCGRWREAAAVLRRMHANLGPRTADVPTLSAACFHKAMSACAAWEQWETCLDIVQEARDWGTEASYHTFKLAVEACARSGRWEEGLNLLMERTGVKTDRRWESQPFDKVMQSLGDAGRWEETATLLGRMREVGAEPGLGTFRHAIRACEKGGEWQRALVLLDDVIALLPPPPSPKESLQKRKDPAEAACVCFASAIRACRRAGEYDRGLDVLLRRMLGAGVVPDALVLNEAINACAAAGRGEQAAAILREMMPAAG
ncbi:unnamed protein product, partial [Scytosiphon promiscuus]